MGTGGGASDGSGGGASEGSGGAPAESASCARIIMILFHRRYNRFVGGSGAGNRNVGVSRLIRLAGRVQVSETAHRDVRFEHGEFRALQILG